MRLRSTRLTAIASAAKRIFSAFSPASLFAAGEPGAWWDPSDFIPDWRYNLLSRTEELDNAVWQKSNATVTANAAVAPNGTLTADKLIVDATNNVHRALQASIIGAAATGTYSCYAKADGYGWVLLQASIQGNGAGYFFDISTGTVGSARAFGSGWTAFAGQIESVGNGWYRCSFQYSGSGPATAVDSLICLDDGVFTFTGDGTSGIYIWGASLTTAENADKPYQKITDGVQDYYTYQAQPVLFQDSAGTTPVTAVEQPVGLMLDKSKGLVLGPELVVNGDFSNGTTGWTLQPGWAVSGGSATFTPGSSGFILSNSTIIAGRTLRVTITVSQGAAVFLDSQYFFQTVLGVGTHTVFVAPRFNGFNIWASTLTTIDNISVRELPGNHAFQSTAASRPVLSARVNLLTKTEQFNDAVWVKSGATVTANAAVAPDGTVTATRLVTTTGIAFHSRVVQNCAPAPGALMKFSVWMWCNSGTQRVTLAITQAGVINSYSNYITVTTTPTLYTYQLQFTSGAGASDVRICTGADGIGFDINVWNPDFRPANDGVGLPAYQRVNTSTDYDTTGFPMYLRFDGVDDGMQTNSINFTATDKVTVWAGVRKLSEGAGGGLIAEISNDSTVNNGSFYVFTFTDSKYYHRARGTSNVQIGSSVLTAPHTTVITGLSDISAPLIKLRISGTEVASSTSSMGTGPYGNYPLYIGRRGGTTLPFNGRLYQLLVRGEQSTTQQIEQTEAYVNGKTKAYE